MPENIKNMGFSYDEFYITEKKILPKLFEFAKKNNYNFEILGAEWNPDEEKNFFNDILNDHNWKFHERTKSNLSYLIPKASILLKFIRLSLFLWLTISIPKGFSLSFNFELKEPINFPRPHPISKILKFELIFVFLIKKLLNELI